MTTTKCFRVVLGALLWIATASVSGASPRSVAAQDDDTLEWLDDYDQAFALAKKTGQPVFLEFRCAP